MGNACNLALAESRITPQSKKDDSREQGSAFHWERGEEVGAQR